jgi:hypothetical protein
LPTMGSWMRFEQWSDSWSKRLFCHMQKLRRILAVVVVLNCHPHLHAELDPSYRSDNIEPVFHIYPLRQQPKPLMRHSSWLRRESGLVLDLLERLFRKRRWKVARFVWIWQRLNKVWLISLLALSKMDGDGCQKNTATYLE